MIQKANSISAHKHAVGSVLPRFKRWIISLLHKIFQRNQLQDFDKGTNTKEKATASFKVANAESVPLPDASFDLVTIM
jgi:hypothetical protein